MVSEGFKKTILDYLKNHAEENPIFAALFDEARIDECCNYILKTVQAMNVQGLDDDEVYKIARDFYNEGQSCTQEISCNVVHNHSVELTEEEKEKLKKEAMEKYIAEQKALIAIEEEKKKEAEQKAVAKEKAKQEAKLEAERKKAEETGQMSLFDLLG